MTDLMRQLEQEFAREFRAIPKPDGLNQCDGCNAGMPISNGLHRDSRGHAHMACCAHKYDGLEVTDCSGIIKGNADLELSDLERIEGIVAMDKEIGYE